MKMILILKGKEIDTIPFPLDAALNHQSIARVKAKLEEKNEEIIDLSEEEPQYLIDGIPSKINFFEVIGKKPKQIALA